MGGSELLVESLDAGLINQLDIRIGQAVEELREEDRDITFPRVVKTALSNSLIELPFWKKLNFLLSYPFNEEILFRYLYEHKDRFGIEFFSEELLKYVVVEDNEPKTHHFIESLGYWLRQLPNTWNEVVSAEQPCAFSRLDICERGLVGTLVIGGVPRVVKLAASKVETEIAIALGEKKLTPRVFEATPSIIAEEYILYPPINHNRNAPELVGGCVGWILHAIHKMEVIYDNRILDHVLSSPTKQPDIRIIDLEGAYRGTDFDVDWEAAAREILKFYGKDTRSTNRALSFLNHW